MGVGGQCHAPAALPPEKTQYPLYRRLGEPQSLSGQVWKTSPPRGFDPQTIQPIVRHHTDYTIPAPIDQLQTNRNYVLHLLLNKLELGMHNDLYTSHTFP